MRKPLRDNPSRRQVSKSVRLHAPTKGWYVGANMADAPEGTAFALNNAFPQLDYIRARAGCAAWATGIPSSPTVSSLMTWTNGATWKMFAVASGAIYDVSSAGAVGAAAVSGLNSSALFQSIQFTGVGGTYLIAVNGVDPSQIYNGSTWTTSPAITGLTGNQVGNVWSFKRRLYFTETGTLKCWYLGSEAIGGAATLFDLTSIFKLGGTLLCGGTWAIDSTSGIYESCVFITTEGEVAVYNGGWPGDSAWTLVGTYKVSKPLGQRCLMQAGGDLGIMTEDGIVPMSKVQTLDQAALQNVAVTAAIAPAWRSAVLARTGIAGWSITIWPLQSMGVVCLPKTNAGDKTQFVANVRTGAWCQYIGWDANCFAVMNNLLYFGTSDGRVMQAEVGGYDDTSAYTVTVFPSFTELGAGVERKHIKMVRAMVQANFTLASKVDIRVDFDMTIPGPPTAAGAVGIGAQWGVSQWGVATWPPVVTNQANWISAFGFGSSVSPVWQILVSSVNAPDVRLTAFDVVAEAGNIVG